MEKTYTFCNVHNEKETWAVDLSGEHLEYIRDNLLNNGIDNDGVNKITFNAAKTLGYCPNPSVEKNCKKTGIVIGKVQSGKTSNFIATIAVSFDNGYDMAVILGGTKKNLVAQNKERVEEYFSKDSTVVVLDTEANASQINVDSIKKYIKNGRKVVLVSLKSKSKIEKIHNNLFKDRFFYKKPVLIIDDEGDEYSLNTKGKKGGESSIYKAILELLDDLYIRGFISVTATPQANLIISTIDKLSPDFGVLVYPGNGYCGLDVFHGEDSKYCIEIEEDEISLIDDDGIPASFYNALAMYFVAAAIYAIREDDDKKFSMMIHPAKEVKSLESVEIKTRNIIDHWTKQAENKDDIAFESLKEQLEEAYNVYKDDGVEVGEFSTILEKALKIIQFCEIHLLTGNNPLNDNDKFFSNNIYIGGQMVGRGLTIKGLALTYIIRSAKGISSVDTVQQRARWFGYKEDILDLCRVFATGKILQDFENIRMHETDMWEMIEENHSNGTQFKKMKKLFKLGEKLRMTRTSVGGTVQYRFSEWSIESAFQMIKEFRQKNIELNKKMYEDNLKDIKKEVVSDNSFHEIVYNKSFDEIINNYLKEYRFPNNSTCSFDFICILNRYLKKIDNNVRCNIVWMRGIKSKSVHTIKADGVIPNYMVGRRPLNVTENKQGYKGDREYYFKDVITIQIHNIESKVNPAEKCPTLAIHIPEKFVNQLMNIVTPE